ncbi:hypothetical protein [Kribbella sp. NPDC048928]|uniref:hypothetical protein n=1 Tax=Kribbella sp. NPDC048928 TaxID=3364111 RepID=UPI00371BF3F0
MKKRFWLWGSRQDMPTVAQRLMVGSGAHFVEHDSYYRGVYLRGRWPGIDDEVIVQSNLEDDEGYFAEDEFREYVTLCYVTQELDAEPLPDLGEVGIDVLRVEEL